MSRCLRGKIGPVKTYKDVTADTGVYHNSVDICNKFGERGAGLGDMPSNIKACRCSNCDHLCSQFRSGDHHRVGV